ncbi:MAG: ankyrin repeat domain-containing protein [Alphaproteobacteria bacterium]|nr:ankyrin repeat domain-containing protein [Alphaproteobacteria bacterium]
MIAAFFFVTACAAASESLLAAAARGNIGAITDASNVGASLSMTNGQGRTALLLATYAGHTDSVRTLIDRGAHIHHQDDLKNDFLSVAAVNGHLPTAKLAIDRGRRSSPSTATAAYRSFRLRTMGTSRSCASSSPPVRRSITSTISVGPRSSRRLSWAMEGRSMPPS